MASELVNSVEFEVNPEPRCHFVLLADTSGSMAGKKIDLVNAGLEMLKTDLCDDQKARNSVELTVVKFDSTVSALVKYASPQSFHPPKLSAAGTTRMAAAINLGISLIEERRQEYQRAGIMYYAPWLWAITDGQPTDRDDINAASERLRAAAWDPARKKSRIDVFMVGVDQPGDPVDYGVLRLFSPTRDPARLADVYAFTNMFRWISQSLIAVSQSQPGMMVSMPPVQGWATAGGG